MGYLIKGNMMIGLRGYNGFSFGVVCYIGLRLKDYKSYM